MSTPVQRQYWELKNQNPEAILFFRLGDFYEMFFEDARIASRILGITLTARHKDTESEMPMCGFPYHSHKAYLETLIEQGYKVAIAEQIEDPETKQITRKVVRIVTPGTSLESGNLNPHKNNFLGAPLYDKKEKKWAIALADLSTGEFKVALVETELEMWDEFYKIDPCEILLETELFEDEGFCAKLPPAHISVGKKQSLKEGAKTLKAQFVNLEVFGIDKNPLLMEVSALVLNYLKGTQKTDLSHIQKIVSYNPGAHMILDSQTMRHLELFNPIAETEGGVTLFSVFEKTKTAMGGRLLRYWVGTPLLEVELIIKRQKSIEVCISKNGLLTKIANVLEQIPDLERLMARLVTGRGNARDLVFIRSALQVFPALETLITDNFIESFEAIGLQQFKEFEDLTDLFTKALVVNPPIEITEGKMIARGYSTELDELRDISKNADAWLAQFLETQKALTGIQNLRVKYSRNFGFCLEVSKGQAMKAPEDWVRKQTLVNAERFTTPELQTYEEKTLTATAKACEIEHKIFLELSDRLLDKIEALQHISHIIAQVDGYSTLAQTAQKQRWVCPEIIDSESVLEIEGGRHPVVEKMNPAGFIANDLVMDRDYFHLITGPNMAGKSTFLRQNALIILLGQIGSFVPAKKARFSLVDRIFTRVGASDNLAAGKSTFFVEMTETASILNAATDKSFIILDEIGRGTSTFDGISLAWAIIEYLQSEVGSKVLFATHYHELIELVKTLDGAANYHVSATQNKKGIVFLRKILKGGISDSFGIEVAKLAGIPASIIKNSKKILTRLESENIMSPIPNLFNQPAFKNTVAEDEVDSELEIELDKIDPDDLSPKAALECIYKLKQARKI